MKSAEQTILGVDIGSVAIGIATVTAAKKIVQTQYAIHKGQVEETLGRLLAEIDLSTVAYVAATRSSSSKITADFYYNNEISFITAARQLHPELKHLLIVGGEKFSLARFDDAGHFVGNRTNTSCAAGTGSFLDQQATRLNLKDVAELCAVAVTVKGKSPKIASRCAVFAKTDLIHAQQEGYTIEEISDGLCRGLARNLADTLFTEEEKGAEIIFCGGVAKNSVVKKHLEELTSSCLKVPVNGHLYGAVGAGFQLLDELELPDFSNDRKIVATALLQRKADKAKLHYYPPLTLQYTDYPDFTSCEQYVSQPEGELGVEVDLYQSLETGSLYETYLGIDIGSTSTKAVLTDTAGEVLAGFYTRTAGRPIMAVQAIFRCVDEISKRKNISFDVIQCGTTGSGRKFIGKIIGADIMLDEITAHARAACQLNPEVDTIIEIGGQDAKFTTLANGRVTSSIMNTVCAAGTGSFIEEQALKLGCPLNEYSGRAENIQAPMVSDRCTVFMERDMNHYLSEGYTIDEVLASALHAVRENYLLKVGKEKHIGKTIFFQGATAKNKALVAAFEQRLGRPILVSKFCHLTGALGTALTLIDEGAEESLFVGFDLYRSQVPITSEMCSFCNNACKISVAEVNGSKVAYGFLCGRDYDTKSFVKVDSGALDLMAQRKQIERQIPVKTKGPVIGLPAAVHLVEDIPMWIHFFNALGIQTLTSEKCKDGVALGKKIAQAEFCAPVTAMYGHVDWLLEQADYVFMPRYFEEKAHKDVRRQYCYYTQYLPALTSPGNDEESRILRPVVKYLYTSWHTKMQLYRMLKDIKINVNFIDVSNAYDKAVHFKQSTLEAYRQLMEKSRTEDDVEVVLVGRPYSVLSPTMNSNIPGIFKKLGINAYYQDMLTYEAEEVENIQPLLAKMHWRYATSILEATEVIAKRKNLYPVLLTSFMCSPDSFTMEYFRSIMDKHNKPYLVLQLDEHDSSVGYETRIEAAVRSFRNHRNKQAQQFLPIDYTTVNPEILTSMEGKKIIFPNWDNVTCQLLAATLRGEGYEVYLMEESDQTIRESVKHNSGQCLPLNAVAQGCMQTIKNHGLAPEDCALWINDSSLACNIRMYPHYIRQILLEHGYGACGVYLGQLSFAEISIRAAKNGYFANMFGGMLRKIVCKIRPKEVIPGETDRVLQRAVDMLCKAFVDNEDKESVLKEIVSRFSWIETKDIKKPKVAVFGDIYARDNQVMNQQLIRFLEENGAEVISTPYTEYAKMIAPAYFRKWFNEGHYGDVLTYKALLLTMKQLEKSYMKIFNRVLDEPLHSYDDKPADILAQYGVSIENTGETMDNLLKIHYIQKHYPDVSLFVQTCPALCCPSLITESLQTSIEKKTGVPVVSVTYDGTGGRKNDILLPYLRFPHTKTEIMQQLGAV